MGKNKNKSAARSADEPEVDKSAAAAAVKHRMSKSKGSTFPWMASVLVLLAAVGVTVMFTGSPLSTVPGVQDEAFKPQDRAEQCASWARDGECENSASPATR